MFTAGIKRAFGRKAESCLLREARNKVPQNHSIVFLVFRSSIECSVSKCRLGRGRKLFCEETVGGYLPLSVKLLVPLCFRLVGGASSRPGHEAHSPELAIAVAPELT